MQELQTFLQKKKGQDTAENHCHIKKARRRRAAMISMAVVGVIPFLAPPVGTDPSVSALAAVADSIDKLFGEEEPTGMDALAAAAAAENEEAAKVRRAQMAASAEQNAFMDSYRVVAGYTVRTWKDITKPVRDSLIPDLEDELLLLDLGREDRLSEDDMVLGAGGQGTFGAIQGGTAGGVEAGQTAMSGETATGKDEMSGAGGTKTDKDPGTAGNGQGGMPEPEADEKEAVQNKPAEKEDGAKGEKDTGHTSGTDESAADAEEAFYSKLAKDIPSQLSVKYNAGYAALKLSDEQLTVLETIVEAEAGDEDAYGKILVANVVLNRVLDEEFPDTVKAVVFQNNGKTYQFSPVRKGGRYYTVKVSKHTKAAVARALEGEDYSGGALYFFARRYTSAKKAKWFDTSLRKIVEYGCHEFFGNK